MKSIEIKAKVSDCTADPIVKDYGRDMNEVSAARQASCAVMQAEMDKWQKLLPNYNLIWSIPQLLSGKGPIGFNLKIDPNMKDVKHV